MTTIIKISTIIILLFLIFSFNGVSYASFLDTFHNEEFEYCATFEDSLNISQEKIDVLSKSNNDNTLWNNASSWAEHELKEANDKNLIPPVFNQVDLTKNITRKELAHLAVRLYEIITEKTISSKADNPFIDTNDEEVLKAYSLGITNGTSENTFSPDTLITREQLATMMTRVLEKANISTSVDLESIEKFSDDNSMAVWSKSSIYFMHRNDIIKGVGDNNFGVLNNATVEQSILISNRISEKFRELIEHTKKAINDDLNVIYTRTYLLDMGSIKVKIFNNGEVFQDIEIEEPNHKIDYKYYRSLNEDEINEIMQNVNDENVIYETIYGKKFTGKVFDLSR